MRNKPHVRLDDLVPKLKRDLDVKAPVASILVRLQGEVAERIGLSLGREVQPMDHKVLYLISNLFMSIGIDRMVTAMLADRELNALADSAQSFFDLARLLYRSSADYRDAFADSEDRYDQDLYKVIHGTFARSHGIPPENSSGMVETRLIGGFVTNIKVMSGFLDAIPRVIDLGADDLIEIARNSYPTILGLTHMSASGSAVLLSQVGDEGNRRYQFRPEIFLYNPASKRISVPAQAISIAEESAHVGRDDAPIMGCPAGIAIEEQGDSSIKKLWDWYLVKGKKFYEARTIRS